MNDTFNYNNIRAREARVGKILGKTIFRVLAIVYVIALFFSSIFIMFYLRNSLGWLAIALAIPIIMLLHWTSHYLVKQPKGPTNSINDLLATEVLALLPKNPTPQTIAKIIPQTNSGRFLMIRYQLSTILLDTIAMSMTEDATPIFQKAYEIYQKTNSEKISAEILAVALIEASPSYESTLNSMSLSIQDLYEGVVWYNYLHGLVRDAKKPRRTGGIGRDLAFGYTPLLDRFGHNVSAQREHADKTRILQSTRQEIIEKIIQNLSQNGRRNAALIGNYGCGRTTITNALAETLLDADSKIPRHLKFNQIISLDASALISASQAPGELENLVIAILNEAYMARNVIISLDNAHLFFKDGTGSVDISNVIMPVLEAGGLPMILELDQQYFLEISARNSALANVLNRIMITPTNEVETIKVLEDQIPIVEFQHKVIYTYQSLVEAYRLSDRYIHDVEMPGKAKLLLESAANFAENGLVTKKSIQQAVEKTQGVKVQLANSSEDKNRLLNLEDLLHQRMVDQIPAVNAVSNALRRAAAGVRNQNRPIGTFLFLGPTGVGKTELAKALSQVYFNGESEIIRIDLNEFVTEQDVNRLIADGSQDPMSLTAQAMKKPFSVVLLDEIEKAHPLVLTTLLQLLDEGILRDTKNHEVSFRDCIIIATSNAGANEIRTYIEQGKKVEEFQEEFTNILISSNQFKPEFLNRFDEICIFKPLSMEDLMQILELNLASINKSLEPQKVSVTLDDDAKAILVKRGYDPRLGARPMRRIMQKTVENFVAKSMLSGQTQTGDKLHITAADLDTILE